MTHLISILIGFHIAYTSASQPFWCHGPLFAETLILDAFHEKFVPELMTRRNYVVKNGSIPWMECDNNTFLAFVIHNFF